jgi:hypothetical protein
MAERSRSIDVQKDLEEIKIDIAEIKVDLRHHIMRTELLEKQMKPIYHAKIWLTYTVMLLGLAATIKGIFL